MRKTLIIALGLASLGVLAGSQLAAAGNNCRQVCDQWALDDYGKRRCYSSHLVCTPMTFYHPSGPVLAVPARKLAAPH